MLASTDRRDFLKALAGVSLKDVAAATPTKEFDATWGSPDLFLSMTYKGMLRHTYELGSIL